MPKCPICGKEVREEDLLYTIIYEDGDIDLVDGEELKEIKQPYRIRDVEHDDPSCLGVWKPNEFGRPD